MKKTKLLKIFNEWKWAAILLSICIAGIPLTTIYGIKSVNWGNDFWPNALSEFLGMFVDLIFGSIFTFVVIDKYLKYHKSKQWKKIKNITYKNLYFSLSTILLKLNWSLPSEFKVESFGLVEDIETLTDYLPKEDLDSFILALEQNIDKIIEQKQMIVATGGENSIKNNYNELNSSLAKFKQQTKSEINFISSSIIPKLLNFSDDLELLDKAIELEELSASLTSKMVNIQNKTSDENMTNSIWLLKIKEILKRIKSISDIIQSDLAIE